MQPEKTQTNLEGRGAAHHVQMHGSCRGIAVLATSGGKFHGNTPAAVSATLFNAAAWALLHLTGAATRLCDVRLFIDKQTC